MERNKGGRPRVPVEVKFARKLNRAFVEMKITEMLRRPLKDLKALLLDDDMESIEHFLAKIIVIGIDRGDPVRLNFLFDRVIGKVTDVREVKTVSPFLIESHDGDKTITLGAKENDSEIRDRNILGDD